MTAAIRDAAGRMIIEADDLTFEVDVERSFNPAEPRDPHSGKWGHGASAILSIPVKAAGGVMHVESDGGGHAKVSDGHGRTVSLSEREARDLGKVIGHAKYGESDHAGGDGVFRLSRMDRDGNSSILVSLRPVPNSYISETGKHYTSEADIPHDEEHYDADFDLVLGESNDGDFKDEPQTRVSLDNLEGRGGIEQALDRSFVARRIPAAGGPVDVFVARPGAVGLRAPGKNGPAETTLNARSYRKLRDTITDAIYGTEDQGDPSGKMHDAHETVTTSSGTFEVTFHGMRDSASHYTPDSTLTLSGDGWTVHATGAQIDDLIDAMSENAGVAGISED